MKTVTAIARQYKVSPDTVRHDASCASCVNKIESALNQVAGVEEAAMNLAQEILDDKDRTEEAYYKRLIGGLQPKLALSIVESVKERGLVTEKVGIEEFYAEILPEQKSKKIANGTYEPSRISLRAGKSATLRFLRTDASPCSSVVVFAGLDIGEELPVGEITEIALPALPPGEYPFTCQMQMYRGDLVVKEN